jgi:hypothetical protein
MGNVGPQDKAKQPKHAIAGCGALTKPRVQRINEISPNTHESTAALMVHQLSITHLRYDVDWALGPFFSETPKHLGRSAALDAAT